MLNGRPNHRVGGLGRQPVALLGAHVFERREPPHHRLQRADFPRRWHPRGGVLRRTEVREEPGVDAVGFAAGQSAAGIGLHHRRIHHTDGMTRIGQGLRHRGPIRARRFQAGVHGPVMVLGDPRAQGPNAVRLIRKRLRAARAIGPHQRDIELPFRDINAEIRRRGHSYLRSDNVVGDPSCASMLSSRGAAFETVRSGRRRITGLGHFSLRRAVDAIRRSVSPRPLSTYRENRLWKCGNLTTRDSHIPTAPI